MAETKKRNQYEYDKKAYDHIHLQVAKGKKSIISEVAASHGESINGYTKKALKAQIKADTGQEIEL